MYWLIETYEQLNKLRSKNYKDVFLKIIPSSNSKHPQENSILCFYLHPLGVRDGYIININHDEGFKLGEENVLSFLKSIKTIYVQDKKEFLHYLVLPNLIDVTFHNFSPPELTSAHKQVYSLYDSNNIVPLVKHYEMGYRSYSSVRDNFKKEVNEFYNNKSTLVFNYLERSGLKVNPILFEKYFDLKNINKVYTQYNIKTLTRRPSNHYQNINYAALNKKNGERECFIPRNDFLLEIDISAYHPTLLSNIVGHKFDTDNIHKELSALYNVDYQKSKQITFQQIYGGVFEQYKHIEFFQKVEKYTEDLWDKFNTLGYIICPISEHKFYKTELGDMTPQKLLNYLLQNLETSNNVNILWDIIKIIRGCKTKIILYTYDSFTFDVDKSEKEVIKKIFEVFKRYNLRIKYKYGKSYGF